eukprot:9325064-Pyramimonas_sp.AAC.1
MPVTAAARSADLRRSLLRDATSALRRQNAFAFFAANAGPMLDGAAKSLAKALKKPTFKLRRQHCLRCRFEAP